MTRYPPSFPTAILNAINLMSVASGKPKILVVDDHAAMRRIICRRCADLEGELKECANAEEALQTFREFNPDWVIMDLKMPGLDGIEATAAMRQLSPTARVIIVSQFAGHEYAEQAREAGAIDFISKEDLSALPRIIQSYPLSQSS